MTKQNNIIIVAHKFLTQPDDELVFYLNRQKKDNVLHIYHSFSDAPDRCSYLSWYKKGKVFKKYKTKDYQFLPEPLLYVKESFFTILWIIQSKRVWDSYIGMDGLCVLWGNLLRSMRLLKKTIFWAIDFVPEKRFNTGLKNKIYHWINIHGYKNADEMWDLSPRMALAREKFLDIKLSSYKLRKVVPYGVWSQRIKKYSYKDCQKSTIVFMGHLIEKQGAQLAIASLPQLIEKIPNVSLKVIGTGNYKDTLVALAKELKVSKYCNFLGKIEDHKELENEIAKSAVAIAPYIKSLDTWTYYADPGKVKTYLACGVPVVLTDLPWNSNEIQKNKCGLIFDGEKEFIDKILFLLKDNNNKLYRKNALRYSQSYDYEKIFEQL